MKNEYDVNGKITLEVYVDNVRVKADNVEDAKMRAFDNALQEATAYAEGWKCFENESTVTLVEQDNTEATQ